ncbi:MAG: IclR family transcriptional regulator [Moraxella sp.]|jgi:DNA-binding IclR family transcriptional regulator
MSEDLRLPPTLDTWVDVAQDTRYVTALARGLKILACFDLHHPKLTHQQIHERTKLPKATISRLLFTLVAMRYLSQTEAGYYQLGQAMVSLSEVAFQQFDIQAMTLDLLQRFAERYHVSVNLATADGSMMQYVACYRSPSRLSVNLQVGSQVPMEQTAIGRAYFATADSSAQQRALQYIARRLDDDSVAALSHELRKHCQFYQQHHYCVSDADYQPDIVAIAVAIMPSLPNTQGNFVPKYVVNASVPKSQWQAQTLVETVLAPLQQLAGELATRLG